MPIPQSREIRQVLLFSGHMIDKAGRETPRFPPTMEVVAAGAIAGALGNLHVGPHDLGITEGACGGDILFAESLLAHGASLDLRLPFREAEFIKNSVSYPKVTPPPDRWTERFSVLRRHPRVAVHPMPDEREPLPAADDPYEQCNLWMLREALAFGAERVRFICLWDGGGGDGAGGTAHMKKSIEDAGASFIWLDTRNLWKV